MKVELLRLWVRLVHDESGQDIIEYALVLGLIAMLAVAGFPPLATAIKTIFTNATTCLQTPTSCGQ
jgi:Flp pilus assembly pilin Flp